MLKKLFLFSSLLVCIILFVNMTGKNNPSNHDKNTVVKLTNNVANDVVGVAPDANTKGVHAPPAGNWYQPSRSTVTYDNANSISAVFQEVDPGARTGYDFQSNGHCQLIMQDPNNDQILYACFTVSPTGASGFPDRRVKAYQSNDGGATWTYINDVDPMRSGFGAVDVLSNGIEIFACHNADPSGVSGDVRTQGYVDVAPGAGVFTRLDAGIRSADNPVWPKICATQNVSLTNKFIILAGELTGDTVFTNVCTDLTTGGFTGYVPWNKMSTAEDWAISRGSDGRIGIAYVHNDILDPIPALQGNVYLIESTDNGSTWGAAQTVWTTNYALDSVGCVRSIDLTYLGTSPRIAMGLCHLDEAGGYFPFNYSKLVVWSPTGVARIDSAMTLSGADPSLVTAGESYFSTCRPTIGISKDNNAIYVAWCRARTDTDAVGNTFFDIYFNYSSNGGSVWQPTNTQLTNTSGPLRDCRYVSMSRTNSFDNAGHYVNMIFQLDSIPGTFVNAGAALSFARMEAIKLTITDPIGIHNISGDVPKTYSLNQNYPNPFNPSTKINFALPKSGFVTLKIYDVTGKIVGNLLNENMAAGNFEYEWNAVDMPSGVYFYTIRAGDFVQTKKMVLVK